MKVEDLAVPPRSIEAQLVRLGWRSKYDRKRLWSAMIDWMLEKGQEHRKYLTAANIRDEFTVFFNDVYSRRFLNEACQTRNPQLNITNPPGQTLSDEYVLICI